jgi:membrane associated rhomboid family serine protease
MVLMFPKLFIPSISVFSKAEAPISLYAPGNDVDVVFDLVSILFTHKGAIINELKSCFFKLPQAVLWCLLANTGMWVLWVFFQNFMIKHAAASIQNMKEKRFWSLPLSAFSHRSIAHLAGNMSVLVTVGARVATKLGKQAFFSVVGGTAAIEGLLTVIYEWILSNLDFDNPYRKKREQTFHIGFSGVNSALLFLFPLLLPSVSFQLGQECSTPVTGSKLFSFIFWFDVCGLLLDIFFWGTGISHIGHLSGYFCGYLAKRFLSDTKPGRKMISWRTRRLLINSTPDLSL